MNIQKHILWVDDEIELLKPHIIYLEEKGYEITAVNSGEDAIVACKENNIDLVLMDEMMTGLDGLSTLKILKDKEPLLPIVMVTKNEEEWLMEKAIAEKISNYLTKPVNPSQVYIACKNILDNEQISEQQTIKEFLKFYNEIQGVDFKQYNYDDWIALNNKLVNWAIKLDKINDHSFKGMFEEQKIILNNLFYNFYKQNYENWLVSDNNKPILSCDLFDQSFLPSIKKDSNLIVIIIDCFRIDQWKKISNILYQDYNIIEKSHFSIIPSATPFARNSIFSGLMPLDIKNKYPDIWSKMFIDKKMNAYEDILFKNKLNDMKINQSFKYVKISEHDEGKKFYNKINDYKNVNILTIVVNFVDILGHSRSESEILKELIPNESAYRQSILNWFQNSWLLDCLKEFANWNTEVVITSDHGNTIVNKPVSVKADHKSSKGVRYKYGRNLTLDSKKALKIRNPKNYMLPMLDVNTEYIIAKDLNYFIYNNQYHKYVNMYKNSFQHGGISLDEIIVPLIHLKPK
tara:strand:- start:1498 stop:3048 length:1551 start_codon:yes stop_codon:yes gene_type:complete